jgi:hypothetical protein
MDGGSGDAVSPRDLAQALPALTVPEVGSVVQNKWRPSDVLALETGAPPAGRWMRSPAS